MGLNLETARYLIAARKAGVSFERTLTLGHQWLCASPEEINSMLERASFPRMHFNHPSEASWADAFFRALGATQIDILDQSAYEGANVIHDLNKPLPSNETRRYTFVFDGGVIEHVFDCATAFRVCMQLTCRGGHLGVFSIANNECGHGFYQFSPELFFRLFEDKNGFTLRSLLVEEQGFFGARWYAVKDPAELGARVVCINNKPLHIKVLARKERENPDQSLQVSQSDYQRAWAGLDARQRDESASTRIRVSLRTRLLRRLPESWGGRLMHFYRTYWVTRLRNRRFFTPADLDCPPFAP